MKEHNEHCKEIAERLEAFARGYLARCPECGEDIEPDDSDTFTCPHCGHSCDVDELEPLSIYDYFTDSIYNIEYRCDSRKEYKSVQIMVACGGPNIYLDTASGDVELYWWTERGRYPMSSSVIRALDEFAEELWNC